ncbi:hypothetical protein [Mucilaginibacter glaciei]|uniref:Uncharacterized protein n=1 Tax=Mucilaginibacter glaciei TaxID=2772109 RepID=A0A926NSN6_9SPHI|nr:hypothetical protein [Mucilaginibacter glaciei]MBD1394292.1 hypothetical protein [Mucilaginibacter glaciei]
MKTKELIIKRTHIALVRAENNSQLSEVCELLEWTEEHYCKHQFYQYQMFVKSLCEGWPAVRFEIEYSPLFRGFFNNEWSSRNDTDFLPFSYDCKFDVPYMLEEYLFIHSYKRLLNDELFMMRFEHVRAMI